MVKDAANDKILIRLDDGRVPSGQHRSDADTDIAVPAEEST